jgi:FAD/FMN-containing dehydrogenase
MSSLPKRPKKLDCYSGMYTARPQEIQSPETIEELKKIFAQAQAKGQKVTLRAGAHAFDEQALGRELVVSMDKLKSIEVLEKTSQVRVEPGAPWGEIVAELQPYGLVPAGTVTSSVATAGGTLASDCLSRFSPRYGKEAVWVEEFSLLTLAGNELKCTRPPEGKPRSTWSAGEEMFMAAAGGFGYLGAIVSITYNLLWFPAKISSVVTVPTKHATFDELAAVLVPATKTALDQAAATTRSPSGAVTVTPGTAPAGVTTDPDAVYAGLYVGGRRGLSWILYKSSFSTETKLHRCPLYWPASNPFRLLAEWLMRVPLLRRWFSQIFFNKTRDGDTYIDDLHDFLFFMDANARARRIAGRFGFNLRTIQQTFIVPVDFAATGCDSAEARLVEWLNHAHGLFRAKGLEPTLQDVLFLPEDLAFNLSPSAGSPGFAVSYAFETSNRGKLAAAQETFRVLADHLWDRFGGRVSLVKNVYVSQETLANMYGAPAKEFFDLKTRYDPQGLLRNKFLERTFGSLVDDVYAAVAAPPNAT